MAPEKKKLEPKDKVKGAVIGVVEDLANAAANQLLSGVAGFVLGPVFDELFGSGPSIEDILQQAVERFAVVVHEEFQRQNLLEATDKLDALKEGMRLLASHIRANPSNWWADKYQVDVDLLKTLEEHTLFLVERLDYGTMGLQGWPSYVALASLRLRILATWLQIPNYESRLADMEHDMRRFVQEHWDMCGKLRQKTWQCFGPIEYNANKWNKYLGYDQMKAPGRKRGFQVEVQTKELLDHLRSLGVSDKEWSDRMPPAGGLYPRLSIGRGIPVSAPGRGADEYWLFGKRSALYVVPKTRRSEQQMKETLLARRNQLLYWIWQHQNEAIVNSLHEVVMKWWTELKPECVRNVGLRASNGQYVAVRLNDRGQLVADTESIRQSGEFQLIDLGVMGRGNSMIALRASNGQFVAAELYTGLRGLPFEAELVANKNWIGNWEAFYLVDQGENKVALRAYNGKYVSVPTIGKVDTGYDMGLTGPSASLGARSRWPETFEIVEL